MIVFKAGKSFPSPVDHDLFKFAVNGAARYQSVETQKV